MPNGMHHKTNIVCVVCRSQYGTQIIDGAILDQVTLISPIILYELKATDV